MAPALYHAMAVTREALFERLAALGIETTTHEHPPVFTVADARRHCGHLPGGHCKSLFLKDKKAKLWLVVTMPSAARRSRSPSRSPSAQDDESPARRPDLSRSKT